MAATARERWRFAPVRHATACLLVLAAQATFPAASQAGSFTVNGVTFSDRLGGFVLEKASGQGSLADPFVLVERMTDPNGGTLSFQVPFEFGNHIGSQHHVGFALVKVIENATGIPWTAYELELQSILGTPSDYYDGLSFGQGSEAGRPFTSSSFDHMTVVDEPYDRVEFDHGRVAVGASATLRFVVTEFDPLTEAYLLQRPSRPIASAPAKQSDSMLAER